jgi:hypothetical protein
MGSECEKGGEGIIRSGGEGKKWVGENTEEKKEQ